MSNKANQLAIVSVMFCFFAMGFVDLVGIASNYVKADLHLNDATANIGPRGIVRGGRMPLPNQRT